MTIYLLWEVNGSSQKAICLGRHILVSNAQKADKCLQKQISLWISSKHTEQIFKSPWTPLISTQNLNKVKNWQKPEKNTEYTTLVSLTFQHWCRGNVGRESYELFGCSVRSSRGRSGDLAAYRHIKMGQGSWWRATFDVTCMRATGARENDQITNEFLILSN